MTEIEELKKRIESLLVINQRVTRTLENLMEEVKDASRFYKKDFHERVCLQSMGCHCAKENFLDRAYNEARAALAEEK